MRAIAARADVSRSLVHHRFKTKEALRNLVGVRITAEFLAEMSVGPSAAIGTIGRPGRRGQGPLGAADGAVRAGHPAGLALIIAGALVQLWLHSQVEVQDALAVTGDAPLDEDVFLDYLLELIAPRTSAG